MVCKSFISFAHACKNGQNIRIDNGVLACTCCVVCACAMCTCPRQFAVLTPGLSQTDRPMRPTRRPTSVSAHVRAKLRESHLSIFRLHIDTATTAKHVCACMSARPPVVCVSPRAFVLRLSARQYHVRI